jgi:ATP-dependent DNA helicase RecG
MDIENQKIDYKSIRKIRTGDKGFKELAISCVAFANAQGGILYIGIEDKSLIPLEGQTIDEKEVNETVSRLHSLCFNVSLSSSGLIKHENGGEYFQIVVAPSIKSIATTSDGKIYLRIADKCEPVRNEDLQRLSIEKGAHPQSLLSEIAERLPDVEKADLTSMVYSMVDNEIIGEGSKKLRKYSLKISGIKKIK